MATHYKFETAPTYEFKDDRGRKHHRRVGSESDSNQDNDPTDGAGSLTYSAASSINSTAESTDSSFADIMRVLDGQESTSKEIAAYIKKEAARQQHHGGGGGGRDEKSVADSLAYSTDAESHLRSLATDGGSLLHGADIASTFTGQASDQLAFDGGGGHYPADRAEDHHARMESPDHAAASGDDILFAPAEHTESLKRRKDRKRRERKDQKFAEEARKQQEAMKSASEQQQQKNISMSSISTTGMNTSTGSNMTPRVKNSMAPPVTNTTPTHSPATPSSSASSPYRRSSSSPNTTESSSKSSTAAHYESRQGTPPPALPMKSRPPKSSSTHRNNHYQMEIAEEEDVWYAKWWMFCFPDAVKSMSPKR